MLGLRFMFLTSSLLHEGVEFVEQISHKLLFLSCGHLVIFCLHSVHSPKLLPWRHKVNSSLHGLQVKKTSPERRSSFPLTRYLLVCVLCTSFKYPLHFLECEARQGQLASWEDVCSSPCARHSARLCNAATLLCSKVLLGSGWLARVMESVPVVLFSGRIFRDFSATLTCKESTHLVTRLANLFSIESTWLSRSLIFMLTAWINWENCWCQSRKSMHVAICCCMRVLLQLNSLKNWFVSNRSRKQTVNHVTSNFPNFQQMWFSGTWATCVDVVQHAVHIIKANNAGAPPASAICHVSAANAMQKAFVWVSGSQPWCSPSVACLSTVCREVMVKASIDWR